MLEAEASAGMLLMTQPFNAPAAVEQPIEVVLVKAVLNGERDRFSRLYEMYSPMVHGILLARVPRGEVDEMDLAVAAASRQGETVGRERDRA